jgi:hypothetical protein
MHTPCIVHNRDFINYIFIEIFKLCWIDFIIIEYPFNNYWIITHILLQNSELYNKLYTAIEDGHFMAETHTVYQ